MEPQALALQGELDGGQREVPVHALQKRPAGRLVEGLLEQLVAQLAQDQGVDRRRGQIADQVWLV